jgi:hypothetical protein
MKPAGKQATHAGMPSPGVAAHTFPGPNEATGIKLTVTVTVVFTNANVVKVEETTNWFLLMKNLLSLE